MNCEKEYEVEVVGDWLLHVGETVGNAFVESRDANCEKEYEVVGD